MVANKLNRIFQERNIKPATFAAQIGLKTSTLDNILKGVTNELNIGVDKIIKICDGLGITVEELYEINPPALSDSEVTLLKNFRNLNEEGKKKLTDYAEDIVAAGRYSKKNNRPNELSKDA